MSHNGFCYRMVEAGSWEESLEACDSEAAGLASLHSLSEVKLLLRLLANREKLPPAVPLETTVNVVTAATLETSYCYCSLLLLA